MPFVDELELLLIAGDGGDGCVSFRREKFVPKGGPDGGDGGKGGDVLIRAASRLMSLEGLASRRTYRAEDGRPGRGAKCSGRDGEDRILEVPVGTLVLDAARGNVLKDLDREGASVVVVRGGKGGRGNAQFASATDRTPRRAEKGASGEQRAVRLVLKTIADVGLLGYPNAGKSTLLGAITSARPKIGAFPFTTLHPNLGILEHDFEPLVIADVPGLIEGAHAGKGLGHRFLRHVERTRILLHLVDVSDAGDPIDAYRAVRSEIEAYSAGLAEKPEVVVLTKTDAAEPDRVARATAEFSGVGVRAHPVSARTGRGVPELVEELARRVREARSTGPT